MIIEFCVTFPKRDYIVTINQMTYLGWGPAGAIGWGVLGKFGGQKEDTGVHIDKSKRKNRLVKNEKGLWVTPKVYEREQALKRKREKKKMQQNLAAQGPAGLWDNPAEEAG